MASCAARRIALPFSVPQEMRTAGYEVVRQSGVRLPAWAEAYLAGGDAAVERLGGQIDGLPAAVGVRVFVAEQAAPSADALRRWGEEFSVEGNFARLVFLRTRKRLTEGEAANPDETYGAFYEALLKRVAASRWPAAQRLGDCLLPVRYQDGTGREGYVCLVLTAIGRAEFEAGMTALLDEASASGPFSRDEASAINALKSRFFEGF
jgi:hypothetical protein